MKLIKLLHQWLEEIKKKIIKNKKYDNSVFYRVKKNEIVEFGDLKYGKTNNIDYLRIGTGGSHLKNNISELSENYNFIRGSVGMVRRGKFDTENSQIFILLNDNSSFDGQFTPIGEVLMGIEILDKIKNGEKFGKMARQFSTDSGSAKRDGSLGYFGRGKMVKEFENAAFALQIGEISEPIKTQYGYHIIKRLS